LISHGCLSFVSADFVIILRFVHPGDELEPRKDEWLAFVRESFFNDLKVCL